MKFVVLACLVGAAVAYPRSFGRDGKFGECPNVEVGELMCGELDACSSDMHCPGTKKCCDSPCDKGKVCLHPVAPEGNNAECFTDPLAGDYRGTVSSTRSGLPCQKWTEKSPHDHSYTLVRGLGDHNYCRNPDDDAVGAWCYTMTEIRWEACDVGTAQGTCGTGKPGQCPARSEQDPDLCTTPDITCSSDIECTSVQKCCDTECGDRRCQIPSDVEEILAQKWKSFIARKKEYLRRLENYPPPPYFFQQLYNKTEDVRICTSTPCEWKKCQRMASEFTYTLKPKREWGCALATSTEHCMSWLEQGYVDIMTTREEDIYTAKTKYNLKPIAYEVPHRTDPSQPPMSTTIKGWQNVTLVIAHTATDVDSWSEMSGTTSCHAHANMTSAFKSPICSLIQKDVIPKKGDFVESASEFFEEMCVPDILNKTYNKNETYPANLVSRCPEQTQQKRYQGVYGSLQCIDDTKGKVAFVDHKVIQEMIEKETELESQGLPVPRPVDNYKLICRDRSYPLTDWEVKSCHVSMTVYPTMFMSPKRDAQWKETMQNTLKETVKRFTSKSKTEEFRIFESSPYTCPETDQPGTNLLFLDETRNFTMVTDEDAYAQDFFETFRTCNELQPKPRAKFCVTTLEKYAQCLEMKMYFDQTDKVKDVAWGCVHASGDLECMKAVLNGTADLMSTNATATFIAGKDFKLQPIISQYLRKEPTEPTYDWKTYTYTVGLMKKSFVNERFGDNAKFINMTKLNTCHAGVDKVSSFHHPIGWLLANGTIPRIGSVFESVSRFFDNSCLPGAHPDHFSFENDLILGHEFNWGKFGVHFFNFTQQEWFTWNSPNTWTYYNWQGKTPSIIPLFFNQTIPHWMDRNSDVDPATGRVNLVNTLSTIIDQLPTEPGSQLRESSIPMSRKGYSKTWPKWSTSEPNRMSAASVVDKIKGILPDSDTEDLIVSKMWTQLLEKRFDAIDVVGDMLTYFNDVPSMPDIQDETKSWLSHPAIQSALQVYAPHMKEYFSEMFENTELRQREFSRYSHPLWLSPKFNDFLEVMKSHQKDLCQRCIGQETEKCALDTDPYSGYRGSMECLKDDNGDIIFAESHLVDSLVEETSGLEFDNLVLVCPSGEVIDYVQGEADLVERCNFGRVPQPVIVTAFNKTGSYRWNITKALLHAQQLYSHHHKNQLGYRMFGLDSVFDAKTAKLYPINLVNQSYEPWLGPMFLRSMEALVKPSSFDWWKEKQHTCWGETYTNIIMQRNDTCMAIVKEVTCAGTPPSKLVYLGRIGEKQKTMIKMCSRPTRFERKSPEFMCDNGDGYLKMVMVPTACECAPCEDTPIETQWNKDYFWTTEEHKFAPVDAEATPEEVQQLWGNNEFWSNRTLNRNFNLTEEIERNNTANRGPAPTSTNQTPATTSDPQMSPRRRCETLGNTGNQWRPEWFPENSEMRVFQVPGSSKRDSIKKMIQNWY